MRGFVRVLLSPLALLVCVVIVGGAGIADAATGGTFILGRSNVATTTTTLTNSAGTPLSLAAKSGHAPLAVNSRVRVPNLNSDFLDGLDSSQLQRRVVGTCASGAVKSVAASGAVTCANFQQPFARTIVVSPGATAVASGTALVNAYASAVSKATASSPWLVLLEPGNYDLNGATMTVQANVQLSGMGEDVTTITSAPNPGDSVVDSQDGAVVTDLSIEATDNQANHTDGFVQRSGTGRLHRVSIQANGALTNPFGLYVQEGATVLGDNVSVAAGGGTIGAYAVFVLGTLTLAHSTVVHVSGSGDAIAVQTGSAALADSEVSGPVATSDSATLTCVGAYDASFVALGTGCA